MGTLRIEQYRGAAREFKAGGLEATATIPMPTLPVVAAAQTLTTSGASTASTALSVLTRSLFLRNSGSTNIAVRIGDSSGGDPVAVATDASLAAGETRWFGIDNSLLGQTLKIAAIDY